MTTIELRQLHRLSRWFGIQTKPDHTSPFLREPRPETLLAALRILGAPVYKATDIAGALREVRQFQWRRIMEPVAVAWAGRSSSIEVRLPSRQANQRIDCRAILETGETKSWNVKLSSAPVLRAARIEGV
ncbi:MAG: hypothetical protein M1608_14765 [Candidatus Omnitrophica bacterium]|nr:hypothetical protein [Candidatus Omnitrophota bacterium]